MNTSTLARRIVITAAAVLVGAALLACAHDHWQEQRENEERQHQEQEQREHEECHRQAQEQRENEERLRQEQAETRLHQEQQQYEEQEQEDETDDDEEDDHLSYEEHVVGLEINESDTPGNAERDARELALDERRRRAEEAKQCRTKEMALRDQGTATQCDQLVRDCSASVRSAVTSAQETLETLAMNNAEAARRLKDIRSRRLEATRSTSVQARQVQQVKPPQTVPQHKQRQRRARLMEEAQAALAVLDTYANALGKHVEAPSCGLVDEQGMKVDHASHYPPLPLQLKC